MGGRLWEIWRSGPAFEGKRQNGSEELEIYFTREQPDLAGAAVVRQIRVTSPFFRTLSGISIRSSFSEIIASFPNLHIDEELTYGLSGGRNEKEIEMFVDQARGIAFEFRTGAPADRGERRVGVSACRRIGVSAYRRRSQDIGNTYGSGHG